jgi:tol-pal system protein YbgF
MRTRNILIFSAAMFASAIAGSLVGPKPVMAVAREIVELQRDVTSILQGQQAMQTQMTQDHTVQRTLIEQSSDTVKGLNSTMQSLQKSVQDVQANAGTRLDTMSTQMQGLSDNLEEIKSRMGKLNQQLVDLQSSVQSIDARLATGGAPQPSATPAAGGAKPAGSGSSALVPTGSAPASSASGATGGPAPSADTLYSNGLRDITSGKYDLANSEFQDYLKYYGDTDLASNAQFYLGEIAYAQRNFDQAVQEYDKVLNNYPKSFKLAPSMYKKGMALLELGQKNPGIKDLREVVKRYPGTEEERRARAKLKEMGVAVTATAAH